MLYLDMSPAVGEAMEVWVFESGTGRSIRERASPRWKDSHRLLEYLCSRNSRLQWTLALDLTREFTCLESRSPFLGCPVTRCMANHRPARRALDNQDKFESGKNK